MHSLHSSSMPSRLLSKCSNPGMVFMSVSNARRCPDVKFMKLLLSVFRENKKRAHKNVLKNSFHGEMYFYRKTHSSAELWVCFFAVLFMGLDFWENHNMKMLSLSIFKKIKRNSAEHKRVYS